MFRREQPIDIIDVLQFIQEAHVGQKYGNMPYYIHPVMVAQELDNPSDEEYAVALLHDVVEDTEYGLTDIECMYGETIADAVGLLTKDETLSYEENIQRIIDSDNIIAMRVKLADNLVNIAGDKSHMSEERRNRLINKYNKSIDMLIDAINEWEGNDG